MHKLRWSPLVLRSGLLLALSCAAVAGTVSPDLDSDDPAHHLQVIVKHGKHQGGSVCGDAKVVDLPDGELCAMTAGVAKLLAQSNAIDYIGVNHTVQSTDSAVYDYLPQTIHPQLAPNAANTPDMKLGRGIGVAVIDSGITASSPDLVGSGANGHGGRARVVYAESFVPGEGVDDYFG